MKCRFRNENKIASVLEGLKVTSHCLAHRDSNTRSWFIRPWMSSMLDAE